MKLHINMCAYSSERSFDDALKPLISDNLVEMDLSCSSHGNLVSDVNC